MQNYLKHIAYCTIVELLPPTERQIYLLQLSLISIHSNRSVYICTLFPRAPLQLEGV